MTPPRQKSKPRGYLYIREWMDHFSLSDETVGKRVGVGRNTVWRWRKEQWRLDPPKMAALAQAIGIEPRDLYRPPGRESIDALLDHAPEEIYEATRDLARRLAAQGRAKP